MDLGAIYGDDQLGFAKKLWIMREYGLGGIWIRGEVTVIKKICLVSRQHKVNTRTTFNYLCSFHGTTCIKGGIHQEPLKCAIVICADMW